MHICQGGQASAPAAEVAWRTAHAQIHHSSTLASRPECACGPQIEIWEDPLRAINDYISGGGPGAGGCCAQRWLRHPNPGI